MDGFLLIDKESGPTSHDVVDRVRSLLPGQKVGHAGTLDPMATGLLVIGLGRATRLLRFLQDLAKSYEARVCFGVATDTLDADGAILAREPMRFTRAELDAVLDRFTGTITQVPPMVSARRVGGRRLYELAREGEHVPRAPRPVHVYDLSAIDLAPGDYPEASLQVRCSKGTYVRSLADDIAVAMGGHAHLTELRRTANGSLSVEDAIGIRVLETHSDPRSLVLSSSEGLRDLPSTNVLADTASAVANGMRFPVSVMPGEPHGEPFRVLDEDGRLLAVYKRQRNESVPEVVVA